MAFRALLQAMDIFQPRLRRTHVRFHERERSFLFRFRVPEIGRVVVQPHRAGIVLVVGPCVEVFATLVARGGAVEGEVVAQLSHGIFAVADCVISPFGVIPFPFYEGLWLFVVRRRRCGRY